MKTYRVAPTLGAICVFFGIANLLLMVTLGGCSPKPGDPYAEAWLLFYAICFAPEPPADIDQKELRKLLANLHRDAIPVAKHFEVISYSREGRRFTLVVRHTDGTLYRIGSGGVRYG
ncbi:MAG: hypothetical protein K8R59_08210 [Thermoanaerobaculales bacterium]|nr:hypothetical protein [Thermoanaerobaculales bacterium]